MDTNINKLTKAPVHVNAGCGFNSAPPTKPDDNTVAGNCGLSSGQFRVNLNDSLGQIITLDFHIIEAVEVIIEGHWFKPATGQNGLAMGRLDAVPATPSSGQSCFNKTARDILLMGMVTGITNPIPLL